MNHFENRGATVHSKLRDGKNRWMVNVGRCERIFVVICDSPSDAEKEVKKTGEPGGAYSFTWGKFVFRTFDSENSRILKRYLVN